MTPSRIVSFLACACVASHLAAQEPVAVPDFYIPLHTQAAEVPGQDPGLWAAGTDYKASFHGDFTFYPVLGQERAKNLPFAWKTVSVTAGDEPLMTEPATNRWTNWRFERHRGSVVEAYDIQRRGVEQTFVLEHKPARPGDVIVTGAITTELHADATETVHGPLTFCDQDGMPILEYGAAVAFDANGESVAVNTSFDGKSISLCLPGSFLETAVFPVVLDPLITNRLVFSSTSSILSAPDIARNDELNEIMVTYGRASSKGDWDLYAYRIKDDHTAIGTAFFELSATTSARYSQAAFVGGSNCWAIAYARAAAGWSIVNVYIHPQGNANANSGRIVRVNATAGIYDRMPSIGGTPGNDSGKHAYVVFRRDRTPSNSPTSELIGALIDCSAMKVLKRTRIGGNASYDTQAGTITRMNSGGTSASWIVAWQERGQGGWYSLIRRISYDGSVTSHLNIGGSPPGNHQIRPKIAGSNGRYLVALTERLDTGLYTGTYGETIRVRRIDWPDGAAMGTRGPSVAIATGAAASLTLGEGRPIAFDHNTTSHWGLAWHETGFGVRAVRMGYSGEIVEDLTLAANAPGATAIEPAACYNDDGYSFHFAYKLHGSPHSVQAVAMTYPTPATRTIGTSCMGAIAGKNSSSRNHPFAGSEFYSIELQGSRPNTLTTLFVAGAVGSPILLPMSPCYLYLDPGAWLTDIVTTPSNATGNLTVPFAIPASARGADLYWQFVQMNNQQILSSQALETRIR